MKKRLLKTGIVCIIEMIAIFVLMALGAFGSLNMKDWSGEAPITKKIDQKDILKGCNDFELLDGKLKAASKDPWIELQVRSSKRIEKLIIQMDLFDEEKIQIFYSGTLKIYGDKYIETLLSEGANEIVFQDNLILETIRIDLTAKKGKLVSIPDITICYQKPAFFLVFAEYLLLTGLSCSLSIILINKSWIKRKILQSDKWKRRYSLLEQVFSLAFSDFKSRFSGSYLGMIWGILQPMSTILLFWFVFQVGFRSNPIDDVPFILWLAAGMIPWNFFYDSWISGTGAFTNYAYIVKKVVFKIEVLPIVKLLSSFILNIIFNGILLAIYVLYRRFPGIHIIDMIYYSVCLSVLSLGLSYITATLNVFIKDIGQILGIILQFLMWLTPMMWSYTMIPDSLSWFYKFNPLHYVINGYRESLINGHWFFYQYKQMILFWTVAILCIFLGHKLMMKLKPHFADVL